MNQKPSKEETINTGTDIALYGKDGHPIPLNCFVEYNTRYDSSPRWGYVTRVEGKAFIHELVRIPIGKERGIYSDDPDLCLDSVFRLESVPTDEGLCSLATYLIENAELIKWAHINAPEELLYG